ncbi:hypothetical protein [Bacillus salipaludis]|uniref:hypothetical protein n=1 Tax=Bacillus salipaludis TaxID=2547811 RepID=UPI002E240D7E|nr:hypothetical protein [Bacillus salipaludis]
MKSPMAAVSAYEEDGIYFRIYQVRHRIKVYARRGKKAVIEHASTPDQAAVKAKRRLMSL